MTNEDNWAEQAAARYKAQRELKALNRKALFDALAGAGLTAVTVNFDGCGDEGQIQSIAYFRDKDEVAAPGALVPIRKRSDPPDREPEATSVEEALEDVAYDLLDETHGSWGDGDGAFGDFRFDVVTRSISLDFNDRFTDHENFQHSF